MGRVSDRAIVALALPALGSLAAEPLFVLVDTAVVGHLGTAELAGLAVGAIILTNSVWLCNFLAYGTTGAAGRLYGAGRRAEAVGVGVQATWLAVLIGLLVLMLGQLVAAPLATLVSGGVTSTAVLAETWLRVALFGAPAIMISLAGQGWMRGVQETRAPLRILIGANLASAIACPILVFGGLGLTGSAIANVGAQIVAATLFLRALRREAVSLRPSRAAMREQLGPARDLMLRTLAFQVCFFSAAAVASRMGADRLAAHQIALTLWTFLALLLDSLAIAAQSLISSLLGAGDRSTARATARRIGEMGLVLGIAFGTAFLVARDPILALFTGDPAALAQARIAWWWFVAMMPMAGLVFALDGVLIGAGDVAFMRNATILAALGFFLPMTIATEILGLGIGGLWAGLVMFVAVRTVACTVRTIGPRWSDIGAVMPG